MPHCKKSHVTVHLFIFPSLKIEFAIANSVDTDKKLHYAAFHLGLHYLQITHLGVSGQQRVYNYLSYV